MVGWGFFVFSLIYWDWWENKCKKVARAGCGWGRGAVLSHSQECSVTELIWFTTWSWPVCRTSRLAPRSLCSWSYHCMSNCEHRGSLQMQEMQVLYMYKKYVSLRVYKILCISPWNIIVKTTQENNIQCKSMGLSLLSGQGWVVA